MPVRLPRLEGALVASRPKPFAKREHRNPLPVRETFPRFARVPHANGQTRLTEQRHEPATVRIKPHRRINHYRPVMPSAGTAAAAGENQQRDTAHQQRNRFSPFTLPCLCRRPRQAGYRGAVSQLPACRFAIRP